MSAPKTAPGGSRKSSAPFAPIAGRVNIPKLGEEVQAALGITLWSPNGSDTGDRHGHISSISNPNGLPLPCGMCEGTTPHTDCFEVVLYESDETPGKSHAANIVAHGLDAARLVKLKTVVDAHRP